MPEFVTRCVLSGNIPMEFDRTVDLQGQTGYTYRENTKTMYIPPKYEQTDPAEVRQFLEQHAFGILVGQVNDRSWGTHIPLEVGEDAEGKLFLEAHMARANPQWRHIHEGEEVLCIFQGPHAYISSSWYLEEEVPTWDYIAVHVYGTLHYQEEEEVLRSLERLIDKYEKGSKCPMGMNDFSKATLRQVKGVVGFRIHITETQAAFKLSQGRKEDHPHILDALNARNGVHDKDLAAAMKRLQGM